MGDRQTGGRNNGGLGPSVQTGVTVGATCRSQLFALWSLAVEARRGRATVAVNLESGACWCGAERVLRTPGNNLHEVETAQGQRFLVSMPSKYRKNIWIKRGDFLIVDPIEEGEKVKAEISFVLCKNHVRSLQKEGHWPEAFSEVAEKQNNMNRESQPELPAEPQLSGEGSSSEDDSDLFVNTNHRQYHESEEESEEDEEEEEEAA